MEAIAGRLEAIASRLEAIASRLEAIASRLEAIASRLEAIASRSYKVLQFPRDARTLDVAKAGRGMPHRESAAQLTELSLL